MEARYAFRKTQLLDECQVAPEIFEQVIPRLYTFMAPFVKTFQGQVADQHAKTYVCGLLSDVEQNLENLRRNRYAPNVMCETTILRSPGAQPCVPSKATFPITR
jgi:hypothetical protein